MQHLMTVAKFPFRFEFRIMSHCLVKYAYLNDNAKRFFAYIVFYHKVKSNCKRGSLVDNLIWQTQLQITKVANELNSAHIQAIYFSYI